MRASVSNVKYLMISTVIECALTANNLHNYEIWNIRGFRSRTYRDMETILGNVHACGIVRCQKWITPQQYSRWHSFIVNLPQRGNN